MFSIVLIGVGGIGFRHFQSIISMNKDIRLFVIDINEDALKNAHDYAESIHTRITVDYSVYNNNLPKDIDLVILATTSIPRKRIFDELSEKHTIKTVIFEKFLFPVENEYHEVKRVLEEKSIKAYVNCPYRLYKSYQNIKNKIRKTGHIHAVVSGAYGLACNMIHYIDMIAYLLDGYGKLDCCGEQLDPELMESKRKGYIDFSGKVKCSLSNGAEIVFESYKEDGVPIRTILFTSEYIFVISEGVQKCAIYKDSKCLCEDFMIEFQSELTSKVVEQLMDEGICLLSSYNDVMDWHIEMLRMFRKKYCEITSTENDIVPIT